MIITIYVIECCFRFYVRSFGAEIYLIGKQKKQKAKSKSGAIKAPPLATPLSCHKFHSPVSGDTYIEVPLCHHLSTTTLLQFRVIREAFTAKC